MFQSSIIAFNILQYQILHICIKYLRISTSNIQQTNRIIRGYFMHEVKVYDSTGKLKKVISKITLNAREQQQIDDPSIFTKSKKFGKLGGKPVKTRKPQK